MKTPSNRATCTACGNTFATAVIRISQTTTQRSWKTGKTHAVNGHRLIHERLCMECRGKERFGKLFTQKAKDVPTLPAGDPKSRFAL